MVLSQSKGILLNTLGLLSTARQPLRSAKLAGEGHYRPLALSKRERMHLVMNGSRWNAKSIRRLHDGRFIEAVNAILQRPGLYARLGSEK